MKYALSIFVLFLFTFYTTDIIAQQQKKPRASLKASVTQTIGLDTEVKITYSRPGVKGRKIFGEVVPFGLTPANEGSGGKPFPWRGGANENTKIEISSNVLVEGKKLSAGSYGMHFIPGADKWIIIFSKKDSLWGSYEYNQEDDALRIEVKPVKANPQEWLMYGFEDLSDYSATAFIHWSDTKVPFKIAVDR